MSAKQKVILLTGASKGFGRLAAMSLLERGHTVIAGVRGGEARAREIFGSSDRLHGVDLHMERPATFDAAVELVSRNFGGRLDVLVNNAGYGLFGSLEDLSEEQLRHQFEVNFFGPMLLTQRMLPALKASQGRVINVSSIVGLVSFPLYGAYAASKHAVEGMTESMYYDLKPHGVSVAMIEPGGFKTEFAASSFVLAGVGARPLALKKVFEDFGARLGDPAKVSRLLVRLCESRRVRVRNLVGVDARFIALLARMLPFSWRLWLKDLIYRKAVFKE